MVFEIRQEAGQAVSLWAIARGQTNGRVQVPIPPLRRGPDIGGKPWGKECGVQRRCSVHASFWVKETEACLLLSQKPLSEASRKATLSCCAVTICGTPIPSARIPGQGWQRPCFREREREHP